jgi:hypothetical protein
MMMIAAAMMHGSIKETGEDTHPKEICVPYNHFQIKYQEDAAKYMLV